MDDVTFHICAGLGGGTGSGSIVDAVAQIRNEFQRTGDDRSKFKIQLYLYVPERLFRFRVEKTATAIISRMDMLPCWN